jgi:hypothetical protein
MVISISRPSGFGDPTYEEQQIQQYLRNSARKALGLDQFNRY